MSWTAFLDIDDPGIKFKHIYIEASRSQAIILFEKIFKSVPESLSCPQCRFEFLIEEYLNLADALENSSLYFDISAEEFTRRQDVLFLDRKQINIEIKQRSTPETRVQEVCSQTGGLLSFDEAVGLVRSVDMENERLLGMYRGVLKTLFEELKKPELSRNKLQTLVKNALSQT